MEYEELRDQDESSCSYFVTKLSNENYLPLLTVTHRRLHRTITMLVNVMGLFFHALTTEDKKPCKDTKRELESVLKTVKQKCTKMAVKITADNQKTFCCLERESSIDDRDNSLA